MFKLNFKTFIALLSFNGSLRTKCLTLNNEPSLARPALINLFSNELHYYPFIVAIGRFNGSHNTFHVLLSRIFRRNKAENVDLNVLNVITRIN